MFTARGISAVGAHHTGSVGVTGSNPVCSTKRNSDRHKRPVAVLFDELSNQSLDLDLKCYRLRCALMLNVTGSFNSARNSICSFL